MIDAEALERKIGELLDNFYQRRTATTTKLDLLKVLKRKNPYLYRALGVESAADIVNGILAAFASSSDETLFGDAFFEPLATFVSGGAAAPSEGVDVVVQTATRYTAIAVKSGVNVFNADSRKKQGQNFRALRARMQKLQKQFDPVVGYCYGKKQQKDGSTADFRELAGQAFWQEITGDPDFYIKILDLMKDKPREHLVEYRATYAAALNRFTKQFIDEFCHLDGTINWAKLAQFNSGSK